MQKSKYISIFTWFSFLTLLVSSIFPTIANAAGTVLSNGTVSIGVAPAGNLIYRGVGVRFVPTSAEALAVAELSAGWGVADIRSQMYAKAGQSFVGSANIVFESFESTSETAKSVVAAAGIMRVTNEYRPSKTPNLFKNTVHIENISSETIDLRYRRVMDWDVPPTATREITTVVTNNARDVFASSDNGFLDGNPLVPMRPKAFMGEYVDFPPTDNGASFDFAFGKLAPGEIKVVEFFYGAAENAEKALDALSVVGAEVYSLAKPNSPDPKNRPLGLPNTFIFGATNVRGIKIERNYPDFTLGGLKVIDNGSSDLISLQARVANSGMLNSNTSEVVKVSFFDGDPSNGGVLIGEKEISDLGVGEFKDISVGGLTELTNNNVFAVVDYENNITECRENNNSQSTVFEPFSPNASISIEADKNVYYANDTSEITATMSNTGLFSYDLKAQIFVESISGDIIHEFPLSDVQSLDKGTSTIVKAEWEVGNTLAGDYRLRAVLISKTNDPVSEAVKRIRVDHSVEQSPLVSMRVSSDKSEYHTDDDVKIDAFYRNLTNNVLITNSNFELTVTAPDGAKLINEIVNVSSLAIGEFHEISRQLNLERAEIGKYSIYAALVSEDGVVLAQNSDDFSVFNDLRKALSGEVTAQRAELDVGDTQSCQFSVKNIGLEKLNTLKLYQSLVNLSDEKEVISATTEVEVDMQQTNTQIKSYSTKGLEEGQYACLLQADIDSQKVSVAYSQFKLNKPPIEIAATFTQPQIARTLVLVDPAQATCTATQSITLEGRFHQAIDEYDDVYAKAFGHHYFALDAEYASPNTFTDTVNHHHGEDIDIAITQLDTQTIQMRISSKTVLEGAYKFYAKYPHGWWYKSLHSGTTHFSCGQTLSVGDQLGHFTVTAVDTVQQLVPDHHERAVLAEVPAREQQQSVLNQILSKQSHTIVNASEDFRAQLLTGEYNQYLILSQEQTLDHSTSKLVREAVNRGEGVVYAGGGDVAQPLQEALGIAYTSSTHHHDYHHHISNVHGYGHSNHDPISANIVRSQQLTMEEHALHTAQTSTLALTRNLLHIKTNDATATATFGEVDDQNHHQHTGHHGRHIDSILGYVHDEYTAEAYCPDEPQPEPPTYPAITVNDYGKGKTVYIGFDLLAEATQLHIEQPNADNRYSALMSNALAYTVPTQLTHYQGSVVPVELTLNNLGIATPGQVTFTLPMGTTLVDSNNSVTQTTDSGINLIHWDFQLAQPDSQSLTLWLKPQYQNNIATIKADIYTGVGTEDDPKILYSSLELSVTADTLAIEALIQKICDELAEKAQHGNHYHHSLQAIHQAHRAIEHEQYDEAVHKLLKATQWIREHEDVQDTRLSIDKLIWLVGQNVPTSAEDNDEQHPPQGSDYQDMPWWSHWW